MKKCHPKLIILIPRNCDSSWVLQKNVFPHFLILMFSNFCVAQGIVSLVTCTFCISMFKIGDEFYHIDRGI